MITYGFRDIYNNTFYFAYLSHINQEQLIIGKYYINGKEWCYEYLGTSEIEESSATFDYQGGPFDDSVCTVGSQYCHHFKVSCSEKDLWVSNGNFIFDGLWYLAEYYDPNVKAGGKITGCVTYIGYEEHEYDINHDSTYLNYISDGYDNCQCQSLHDIYEFESCDDKPIVLRGQYVKYDGDIVQGEYYRIIKYEGNCFVFNGIKQGTSTSTIEIQDGGFSDCNCEDKPEPPTTENSECVVSTCKGTEQHINVSNDILNLLEQRGYHTLKWNNKCYYIVEVVGEENPELPIMDIEYLNGIYPGCTECNNDGVTQKDNTEYYEKVDCEFADAVYNKAMSERYGVEFCCEKDLQRLTIKKKLLDAGQLQDDIDLCLI